MSAPQPRRALALLTALWLAACAPVIQPTTSLETFVRGLNQPRGMAFDGQGNLYVAEAGARLPAATGEPPADLNHSGRVLRITPDGRITTVADGLPYTYSRASGDVGVSDVALHGDTLYLLTGEGYDDNLSRTVLRVESGQPPQRVASILNFAIGMSSSTEQVIGSVTSNPFALALAEDGTMLYVSDGATGRILQISLDGQIRVFAEIPGPPGSPPPLTGLTFGPDGRLYVAMFSTLPHSPGSGEVWAANASGEVTLFARGLTMPIDIVFDAAGALYVLEFSDGRAPENPYAPGGGRLLRITTDNATSSGIESDAESAATVVLDHLDYPTALAFSPSGDLYVTTGGAFRAAGEGAIRRLPCAALAPPNPCPPRPHP